MRLQDAGGSAGLEGLVLFYCVWFVCGGVALCWMGSFSTRLAARPEKGGGVASLTGQLSLGVVMMDVDVTAAEVAAALQGRGG